MSLFTHILLIEDNQNDIRKVKKLFKEFRTIKANLIIAGSLKEGIEVIGNNKVCLILLDISLTANSGVQMVKRIHDQAPQIPIVVLTKDDNKNMAQKAVAAGAQDYLIKDGIDSAWLERSIQYAIERNKFYRQRVEIAAARMEKENLKAINEKLKKTLHDLEKSNRRLEEFAYVATHNLRAPVVNLVSLIEYFENGGDKDSELVMKKIESTADHLYNTLHGLIDVVDVSNTVNAGEVMRLEFQKITDDILMDISSLIKSSNATIHTDYSHAREIVYPENNLKSIISNLVTNAIRFSAPDRSPEVWIKTSKKRNKVLLEVKDNGIGIDLKKYNQKLFKMFEKLDHQRIDGMGLGLYLVKLQVEMFHGHLNIQSKPGKGSVFEVSLINNPDLKKNGSKKFKYDYAC